VPRQDLTGADRTWAERYNVGDVLRYSRNSHETGIGKGEYARVKSVDAPSNRLIVELKDGTDRSYNPRRQQGVSVYREEERAFSTGDRVQLTAPSRELKAANRELGTVEGIGQTALSLRMDGGRAVQLDPRLHPHLDHGYAVTSHSSQGQTADRVLIHVDTELGAKDLLNSRMAYVAVSRGAYDAQLFTNNRDKLGAALGHDVSHRSAHAPEVKQDQAIAPQRRSGHGRSTARAWELVCSALLNGGLRLDVLTTPRMAPYRCDFVSSDENAKWNVRKPVFAGRRLGRANTHSTLHFMTRVLGQGLLPLIPILVPKLATGGRRWIITSWSIWCRGRLGSSLVRDHPQQLGTLLGEKWRQQPCLCREEAVGPRPHPNRNVL